MRASASPPPRAARAVARAHRAGPVGKRAATALLAILLSACAGVPLGGPVTRTASVDTTSVAAPQRVVAGGELAVPHGLAAQADGHVVVGALMAQRLLRVSPDGVVRTLVDGPEGFADDVATDAAGRVAWTHLPEGALRLRAPDGTVSRPAPKLSGLGAVALGADGTLWAADAWDGTAKAGREARIWRVPANGAVPERPWLEKLPAIASLRVGTDGALLAAAPGTGRVLRIDPRTRSVDTRAEGFGRPVAAAEDPQGRLWVLDAARDELLRVDRDGRRERWPLPAGADGLAVAGDRVVVASGESDTLHVLAGGTLRVLAQGGLQAPTGLAVIGLGADERVLVADGFALRRVDARGGLSTVWKPAGTMAHVFSVGAAPGGALWVSSWAAGIARRIDPSTGSVQREIGRLSQPHAVLELSDGSVVVAEAGAGRLLKVSADGRERAPLAEGLGGPVGLVADGSGLYVTEAAAGRVSRVDPLSGHVSPVAEGLSRPTGIAWASGRRLLVMESGRGRLVAIEPGNGSVRTVADGLPAGLPGPAGTVAWGSAALAVTRDGSIWFTSDRERAVYRIPPR